MIADDSTVEIAEDQGSVDFTSTKGEVKAWRIAPPSQTCVLFNVEQFNGREEDELRFIDGSLQVADPFHVIRKADHTQYVGSWSDKTLIQYVSKDGALPALRFSRQPFDCGTSSIR